MMGLVSLVGAGLLLLLPANANAGAFLILAGQLHARSPRAPEPLT